MTYTNCSYPDCYYSNTKKRCIKPNPYPFFMSRCLDSGRTNDECKVKYNNNKEEIKKGVCDLLKPTDDGKNYKTCPKDRRPYNNKCKNKDEIIKLNRYNVKCCYKKRDYNRKVNNRKSVYFNDLSPKTKKKSLSNFSPLKTRNSLFNDLLVETNKKSSLVSEKLLSLVSEKLPSETKKSSEKLPSETKKSSEKLLSETKKSSEKLLSETKKKSSLFNDLLVETNKKSSLVSEKLPSESKKTLVSERLPTGTKKSSSLLVKTSKKSNDLLERFKNLSERTSELEKELLKSSNKRSFELSRDISETRKEFERELSKSPKNIFDQLLKKSLELEKRLSKSKDFSGKSSQLQKELINNINDLKEIARITPLNPFDKYKINRSSKVNINPITGKMYVPVSYNKNRKVIKVRLSEVKTPMKTTVKTSVKKPKTFFQKILNYIGINKS